MARPSSSRSSGKGRTTRAKSPEKTAGSKRIRSSTAGLFDEGREVLFQEPPPTEIAGTTDFHPGDATPVFEESTRTVPKSFVKFIVALFLVPPAWILTEAFFQAFTTSVKHGLLATQTFGCFAAGMIFFGILCLVIPQRLLMIPYVLGHEITHALWVWIFGGTVADHFHVSQEGGHVETDRVNTWIILAPYFFPIYSILVVTIYGAVALAAHFIGNHDLIRTIDSLHWLLFLLIGVTLAFHLVFTCLLITKGQPDLHYGGTFFSLMVIYLINLIVITGLLFATGSHVSLTTYGHLIIANSINFVETCSAVSVLIVSWIKDLFFALRNN